MNYLSGSSPGTGRVSYFTSAPSVRWSYVYHNGILYNESSWAGYRFHGISWFENVMASKPLIFYVVMFLWYEQLPRKCGNPSGRVRRNATLLLFHSFHVLFTS